jgi:hypothetical protein
VADFLAIVQVRQHADNQRVSKTPGSVGEIMRSGPFYVGEMWRCAACSSLIPCIAV